jgi:hypothetical protein
MNVFEAEPLGGGHLFAMVAWCIPSMWEDSEKKEGHGMDYVTFTGYFRGIYGTWVIPRKDMISR